LIDAQHLEIDAALVHGGHAQDSKSGWPENFDVGAAEHRQPLA
jgi:hypothetical protein